MLCLVRLVILRWQVVLRLSYALYRAVNCYLLIIIWNLTVSPHSLWDSRRSTTRPLVWDELLHRSGWKEKLLQKVLYHNVSSHRFALLSTRPNPSSLLFALSYSSSSLLLSSPSYPLLLTSPPPPSHPRLAHTSPGRASLPRHSRCVPEARTTSTLPRATRT